jgi:hypothetical protein
LKLLEWRKSMRHWLKIALALSVGLLLASAPSSAKDDAKYKTAEAKHFDRAEGVEVTPEFSDYLYAELRTQLQKTKLFGQVIGEGEVVEDADAPASVVVTGTLTEYKKGNMVENRLVGFGAGRRSLKLTVNVVRRSDKKSLGTIQVHVKANPQWNERILAVEAAKEIAHEVKDSLEHSPA